MLVAIAKEREGRQPPGERSAFPSFAVGEGGGRSEEVNNSATIVPNKNCKEKKKKRAITFPRQGEKKKGEEGKKDMISVLQPHREGDRRILPLQREGGKGEVGRRYTSDREAEVGKVCLELRRGEGGGYRRRGLRKGGGGPSSNSLRDKKGEGWAYFI